MNLKTSLLLVALGWPGHSAPAADIFRPDATAIDKVAALLTPKPTTWGRPVSDREAWTQAARRLDAGEVIHASEALLKVPLSEPAEDLYLDLSRTGNQARFETAEARRRSRLMWFVLAEGLENKGRFLKPLEETIRVLSAERTWVAPTHDRKLNNFHGKVVEIDLWAAMLGWNLASTDQLLGDRLSPEIRALLRAEIQRRIFDPYRLMVAGQFGQHWLLMENNWNSVCLAGVTGAALALREAPRERAWFVLAAEKYSHYALKGFTPDGYCSEGLGYWDYGFGHYTVLTEVVRAATGGQVDFLARPEALAPATYGSSIEIIGGVCPAFADCPVAAQPDPRLVNFLNARFGLGLVQDVSHDRITSRGTFYGVLMWLFPPTPAALATAPPLPKPGGLRSWFPDAGVLICRPGAGSPARFGLAMLGGDNGASHNHNDVGNYVVVVGQQPVLPDIGGERYTARTFSSRRYESKAINSFGHAVPLVAGTLQSTGRQAASRVLHTQFTDEQDTLAFDIKSAYAVPSLQTLNRTFVYSRRGPGSLTLTDEFEFSTPETFENALLTFGQWERLGPGTLRIANRGEAVRVEITTPAHSTLEVVAEAIHEDLMAKRTATRLGLRLKEPIQRGTMVLRITPEAAR